MNQLKRCHDMTESIKIINHDAIIKQKQYNPAQIFLFFINQLMYDSIRDFMKFLYFWTIFPT